MLAICKVTFYGLLEPLLREGQKGRKRKKEMEEKNETEEQIKNNEQFDGKIGTNILWGGVKDEINTKRELPQFYLFDMFVELLYFYSFFFNSFSFALHGSLL